jgi:hypothetical protein
MRIAAPPEISKRESALLTDQTRYLWQQNGGNQNVLSVMIEINRDLYLEPTVSASKLGVTGHPKKSEYFEVLRHQITSQLLIMAHEAESRLG